ncbi:hypothetical protein K432DRAFT_169870 [Lepidopterella palustris CBS 459.81]|uniref:Uncharacterized protein n=1 Tax=Lepidopterella palustris CBS 459.81 TaxID=1314670 RepID=A0A8E2JID8_9PEZI|nr:hypothetical protein K432DRAFT_169870 [Lepidopterella palustris CBS 459.81]
MNAPGRVLVRRLPTANKAQQKKYREKYQRGGKPNNFLTQTPHMRSGLDRLPMQPKSAEEKRRKDTDGKKKDYQMTKNHQESQ